MNWYKISFAEIGPVYHGTNIDFSEFGESMNSLTKKLGLPTYFFTDNPAVASSYGDKILKFELNIDNPLILDMNGSDWMDMHDEIISNLQKYKSKEAKDLEEYKEEIYSEYEVYEDLPEDIRNKLDRLSFLADEKEMELKDINEIYGLKYDGVIIKNVYDMADKEPSFNSYSPYGTVYVVFDKNQIRRFIDE